MTCTYRIGLLLLVGWVLASTWIGRSFTALDPGSLDAQLFAYIGEQWLRGRLPYVDVWESKPPGIFAINALVFWKFPGSFTGLAGMEGLFILGCIGTVYALMRQFGAPWPVTALATLATAIATNLPYYNQHGNLTEIYLLWPAALSIWCFCKALPDYRMGWMFLAGCACGIATLFKANGFSPLLAETGFLLLLWGTSPSGSLRLLLTAVLANVAGLLMVWCPVAIYFALYSSLWELWNASLLYGIQYGAASQPSPLLVLPNVLLRLQPLSSLAVSSAICLVSYGITFPKKPHQGSTALEISRFLFFRPLILLWMLIDLNGALVGGRNYAHYFLCLTPSLSVAASLGFWQLIEQVQGARGLQTLKIALFALILGPLVFVQVESIDQIKNLIAKGPPPKPWQRITEHLNAIRRADDTLFVWDYRPAIYMQTHMKNAVRVLTAEYKNHFKAADTVWTAEILSQLRSVPPSFIVDFTREPEKRGALDTAYRAFHDLLQQSYDVVLQDGNITLYEKNARRREDKPDQR